MASAVGKGENGNETGRKQEEGRCKKWRHDGAAGFHACASWVQPGLVLGPGKVELLEAIDLTGSISAAAAKWGCLTGARGCSSVPSTKCSAARS